MCSWCWGFSQAWHTIQKGLPPELAIQYVHGGLAPDSDEPMSQDMRENIKAHWHNIERVIPGTQFNYDFWVKCQAYRSTYPSCRAVIAAKNQGTTYEKPMLHAIQHAYYLEAKNPSIDEVLIGLACDLDLDLSRFARDLNSVETQAKLIEDINLYHALSAETGVSGFPSLVLKIGDNKVGIPRDYHSPRATIDVILYHIYKS